MAKTSALSLPQLERLNQMKKGEEQLPLISLLPPLLLPHLLPPPILPHLPLLLLLPIPIPILSQLTPQPAAHSTQGEKPLVTIWLGSSSLMVSG